MIKGLAKTGDRVFIVAVSLVVTLYIFFAGTIASGFMSYAIIGFAVAHVSGTGPPAIGSTSSWESSGPRTAVRGAAPSQSAGHLCPCGDCQRPDPGRPMVRCAGRRSEAARESILCPPLMIAIFANIAEVPQLLNSVPVEDHNGCKSAIPGWALRRSEPAAWQSGVDSSDIKDLSSYLVRRAGSGSDSRGGSGMSPEATAALICGCPDLFPESWASLCISWSQQSARCIA